MPTGTPPLPTTIATYCCPVGQVADRRRARHVVQARPPELLARSRRRRPRTRDRASRRTRRRPPSRARRWSAARAGARPRPTFFVSRLIASSRPYLPSLSGRGRTVQRTPRRQAAAFAVRTRRQVHARLDERHDTGSSSPGCTTSASRPAPPPACGHTILVFAVAGDEPRVDRLGAGLRIDRRHDVLQSQVDREHVLAGLRIDDVEDRLLAGGDDDGSAASPFTGSCDDCAVRTPSRDPTDRWAGAGSATTSLPVSGLIASVESSVQRRRS